MFHELNNNKIFNEDIISQERDFLVNKEDGKLNYENESILRKLLLIK
jgi:hypothetical protein